MCEICAARNLINAHNGIDVIVILIEASAEVLITSHFPIQFHWWRADGSMCIFNLNKNNWNSQRQLLSVEISDGISLWFQWISVHHISECSGIYGAIFCFVLHKRKLGLHLNRNSNAIYRVMLNSSIASHALFTWLILSSLLFAPFLTWYIPYNHSSKLVDQRNCVSNKSDAVQPLVKRAKCKHLQMNDNPAFSLTL